MMRILSGAAGTLAIAALSAGAVSANPVVSQKYCALEGFGPSLRQTMLIIDGRLVRPEDKPGPNSPNAAWRRSVAALIDPLDPSVGQRLAPRERVTVAIAERDGSGLRAIFVGCVPILSADEKTQVREKGQTAVDVFFGADLASRLKKAAEDYRRKLVLAMVEATSGSGEDGDPAEPAPFTESGLLASMANGPVLSHEHGIPRYVVFAEFSGYELPRSDIVAARSRGRRIAEDVGLDLKRAEVHLVGLNVSKSSPGGHFLDALLLRGNGKLESAVGKNGTIASLPAPKSVEVYHGIVTYPDGDYPMRMRLAVDQNGTAINSWVEVQSDLRRTTPFGGLLTCEDNRCSFVGDRIFAQIWSDDPDAEAEFENWMPFAGFRELRFTLRDGQIEGVILDSQGYVPGLEDGLPLRLQHVENGLF